MKLSRTSVAVLGGVAAGLAGTVGAVSLTRIAGDYLGFPPGLEWTLTGAVDVAGIAGGVMWTAFAGDVRRIGRPMNIVCTVVSGVGVGLDHAANAGHALRSQGEHSALPGSADMWPYIAFSIGLFVPILATWILHALSIITDSADRQDRQAARGGDRQLDRQDVTTLVIPKSPPADRQPTATPRQGATATPPPPPVPGDRHPDRHPDRQGVAPRTATPAVRDRQALPAGARPASCAPAEDRPSRALHAVPSTGERPPWMTDELIDAVVASLKKARAERRPYGRPSVEKDHRLTKHKALTVMTWIDDHDLLKESA